MRKKTLITGAGRGIGEQIALKFGSEQHDLILLIQKKEQYPNIMKKLKKYNIKVDCFIGDLKDQKFLKVMFLK